MKIGRYVPIAISAILPGLGHIAAGRTATGLLLFFLFGFAVDGYFYSQALGVLPAGVAPASPELVRTVSLAGAAVLWLLAVADSTRIALRRRRLESRAHEATAHIRDGLVAYLRNDLRAAARALHAALRINDRDPDALYHLGVVYAAAGHRRKARRALQRCIQFDGRGKWDAEAHDHLRALDAAPPAPAAPPATKERPREAPR